MRGEKSVTHEKLTECMRKEFLEKGFENASLNNIARTVGITPAAVYKHFENKEAMFEALVTPALEKIKGFETDSFGRTIAELGSEELMSTFDLFGENYRKNVLDLIYSFADEFYLLLVCSAGTKFAEFSEGIISDEAESTLAVLAEMKKRGLPCNEISYEESRVIAEIYMNSLFRIVREKMTREDAEKYLDLMARLFYPGMKEILGM